MLSSVAELAAKTYEEVNHPERLYNERHTKMRLAAAQKLCEKYWKTNQPPFFKGGGEQCDIYGFYAAENTMLWAKHRSIDAGADLSDSLNSKRNEPSPPLTEMVCLRIPRATLSAEEKVKLVQDEAHWRDQMKQHGIKGVQFEIQHDLTSENELGSPYIALEWADGKPLKWNDSTPEKPKDREKVIRQVVQIQLSMLRIRTEGVSAREYMQKLINNQIQRISQPDFYRKEHPIRHMDQFVKAIMTLYGNVTDRMHEVQRNLLDKHIIPELDLEPHVLIHGDLGPGNIIIDDMHNVTVIDLGFMHQEPLQLAAYFPRFLTHEPSSVQSEYPLDGRMDVFGWVRGWGQTDSVQEAKDRKYYMDYVSAVVGGVLLKPYEKVDEELMRLTKLYSQVLHREDEVERFWWMQAMQRMDVWLEMERCNWRPREGKKKDVDVDVDAVAGPLSKPLGSVPLSADISYDLPPRKDVPEAVKKAEFQ